MIDSARYVCTSEEPWSPEKSERAQHPSAFEIEEDYGSLAEGGSGVKMKCPHCGLVFWSQLPD